MSGAGPHIAEPRAAHTEWTENGPRRGWPPSLDLRELWRYREVPWVLAVRDLKVRYRQAVFGVAWAIVQPLLGVVIFSVVFGRVAGLESDGLPYPAFAFAGLLAWTYVARATEAAADSLVGSRDLVTKIYFPRLLAPVAALIAPVVELVIGLFLAAGFIAVYGTEVEPQILLTPFWIVAAVAVALGVGVWVAAVNVQYRDVSVALPVVVQLWLFASPVVWSPSLFDGAARWVVAANPMVGVIDGFRWSLLGGPAPPAADLVSVAVALAVLAGGVLYFRAVESRFADVI